MALRTGLRFNPGDLPYNYKSAALAGSGVIQSGNPVRIIRIMVTNSAAAAKIFQFFDSATVPGDGATPDEMMYVPGNTSSSMDFSASADHGGRACSNGASWAESSSVATKTLAGTDFYVTAQYE